MAFGKLGLAWKLWRIWRKLDMEKLKSRKLWAAIAGAVLTIIGSQLGLTEDQTGWIVKIVIGYIVGQGAVDAIQGLRKK